MPFVCWHSIGTLTLDTDGHLWERYRGGWAWLGPVAEADVPARLEPAHAALLDLWRDAFDPRAEQLAAYRLSVLE